MAAMRRTPAGFDIGMTPGCTGVSQPRADSSSIMAK